MFSGWDHEPVLEQRNSNADEEGDGEWLPPNSGGFGKELSILPTDHEVSDMGTVIRHPVADSPKSDSEGDGSELEEDVEEELETELKALKEDFEEPASQFIDIRDQAQVASGPLLRSSSVAQRPSSADTLRRGSLLASSLSSKRSRVDDYSPRASKAVRFNKGEQAELQDAQELAEEIAVQAAEAESEAEEDSAGSSSSDGSSEISSDEDDTDEEEDVNDESSDDEETSSESSEEDSGSDESASESSEEDILPPPKKARPSHVMNPPGQGSVRTKKSNHRYKLRRRLSKLKEIGVLPANADFAALRAWEEANGGWHFPDESSIMSTAMNQAQKKEQEQREFEEKRQKLLQDLASGGVDVDETTEKENVPPRAPLPFEPAVAEEPPDSGEPEVETTNRRTLDIASSRRLVFGSLGMRAPKTKEDEEAARRKLAVQAGTIQAQKQTAVLQAPEEDKDEADVDWESKLVIRATECVFKDIEMTAPPFPFKQRWDERANAIIRQRKGWGKKRKRKQRIQVYNGGDYEDWYEDENGNAGYVDHEGNMELNYNEEKPVANTTPSAEVVEENEDTPDDLPTLPSDLGSVPDLAESEATVGAIIAFRQLDMSKATNWQPRMSEYRVAEVHDVLGNGNLNVRLALRDRKPKADPEELDEGEPRQYSKFEMPGFDDDEEEDDGYREVAFAELNDPKLLRPAPVAVGDNVERGKNDQEGSMSVN